MEVSEELMLTWGSHQLTLVNEVAQLRHRGCFADVTLACEGRLYLAHKFILAMCSDYFRNIFGPSGVGGSNSSLVVVLKDVTCQDVEHLLDYMYTGVVAVEKSGLHSLIRTAENLQIKGLAFADSPDVPPPSPERHDPSVFVGGTNRQDEVITEDHSPTNSKKINNMGPDVRLNRGGSTTSRVPVNSREGVSPPSKRKRLQDSLGQSISNTSNTNTTFTNNVRTSSLVSQQQIYGPKRRVSSPGDQPSFCSSSPTDVPLMPIFTEPLSPVMHPGSPSQFRQAGSSIGAPLSLASRSFRDSPERPQGPSDHHSPVSCFVPTVVSSPLQTVSVTVGYSPKGRSEEGAQRPENLEIKKEEPDGDATAGAATEIHLSVDGGGPSNEASELKEEPPPEEGESGSSGLHPGLECWGAAAEGGLLADVADEDDISDTDGTGDEANSKRSPPEEGVSGPRSPSSVIRTDFKTEPEVDSPALFSMPATPVTELETTAALGKVDGCVLAETGSVACSPKPEKENEDQDILTVGSSVPTVDVVSASRSRSPGSDSVSGDCEPRITPSGVIHTAEADGMCTKVGSLPVVNVETSTADATHSQINSELTRNSFENIDRVEDSENSNDAGSSAVWKSIGKSIFEVASPVASIKESEQDVTLPVCLYSIENDATPKNGSALRKSVTSLIGMKGSRFEYSSVLSQISDAAATTTESLCHKTSNLGESAFSTKSKLIFPSSSRSRTSLIFSSSTVPSLLRNFDELTSIYKPTAHNISEEENDKEEAQSHIDPTLAPKHTNFPTSSISESTSSEITSSERNTRDDRSCGSNDHPKRTLCTGRSENGRPFVDLDNPLSDASTVLFEPKSVPMSIDSESSPENPDSDDLIEPVSSSNPSGTPLHNIRLLSDSSQHRDNAQKQLSQTTGQVLDTVSSYGARPHSGPRSCTFTVRCSECPYTTASLAQLESHVRELHPDYFSQTMRSFRDAARTEHRDSVGFRHREIDARDAGVCNSLPLGVRPRHSSGSQQKNDVVVGVRVDQSAPSVPSRPSINQTQSVVIQSDQVERHCTQIYTGSHKFSAPLTVNVSSKSGAEVSQTRPSISHTLLMRVPQLHPSHRMESPSPSDMRGQHDARGYSSSPSWHLALRNPLQPPQFVQRFPTPHTNPQISPQSSQRSRFHHQLSQPRGGPTQPGLNRNLPFTTSYSNSVASTLPSVPERSSQLPQNNFVHMINHPTISTLASVISQAPGSLPSMAGANYQPLGSFHRMAVVSSQPSDGLQSMAGANLNSFAGVTVNTVVRMSQPSPVHSSHTATNNLRVQPVRVSIFPRCNERDLETVRQMAYPSVSGTQNLASFPSPLDFSDPPNFSQPPQQPVPFLNRSPSASARLTIQPESERKFTCPYCYMTLFGRQTLFDHVAVHANNDRSTYRKSWCPYCTLKCGSQQQLVNHFKSHTAEEIR